MSIGQYLKDTQGELRHVAWPTRLQTIVYSILVALLSIVVALYLGLFDYIFTTGLARFLEILPGSNSVIEQPFATTTNSTSSSQAIQDFQMQLTTTTEQ
ncbi:preprotein translocase subunit SecE [Candidatus Kaiserbacteria bacterium RIFCSPHIGHO2_01_FULL_54_36]|uniref:Protein translocase subunit SecE n=1 Tax=Candidatus Kaiserbacteria bacterium RIFCSPHIGHO2_01_FULL_54_36 TaxID=1798482 RepID=A0A1F6CLI6_9BACT|nr:MAG: preprotein translocase subunit SecE [Candidatus Kaiserbacteria bacterium RIFCSPHIGHO2_01_FULL_54_36]OGG75802.1 MAG: preprotein translocase subunit SecE [Candidatus Kaiserbacteria bacterium RIFCSPLOWO2_01_FULL_54_22]